MADTTVTVWFPGEQEYSGATAFRVLSTKSKSSAGANNLMWATTTEYLKADALPDKLFFSGGDFWPMHALNLSYLRFSAPKLDTSALVAILYMFVAQTAPTH